MQPRLLTKLGSVHQVPITAGWTKVVWNRPMKFAWPSIHINSTKN